jgi:hypothetical protein
MGKNFTTAFALCLAISALPLACGDDEDDDGGDSKGGKGGSAGSSTGGRAGSSTGGRGGSAGSTTGGRGGSAGSGGMTGGTAGSATGGMGGAEGGMGGADDGGMGGEGGAPMMSLCERYCDAGDVGSCTNTGAACVTSCEQTIAYGVSIDPGCEALFTTLYECAIAGSGMASDWACNMGQPNYTGDECDDEAMAANDGFCFG